MVQLEAIKSKIDGTLEKGGDKLDPYSKAHLLEASRRIESVLDADFIYNASNSAPQGITLPFHGQVMPHAH